MGTYRQVFYQLVFGTKNRKPTIAQAYDKELYQYISGIIKNVTIQSPKNTHYFIPYF